MILERQIKSVSTMVKIVLHILSTTYVPDYSLITYLSTSVSLSARLITKRKSGVDNVLLCSNRAAWLA